MRSRLSILVLLALLVFPLMASAQDATAPTSTGEDVEITSGGQVYQSYLAAPDEEGVYPGIILIHSFRGLENGYRTMVDNLAAEGYVVLALGWQTFEQSPADDIVSQLIRDGVAFLSARENVDPARLGLTGFCAGGRYTMLFLPQLDDIFKAGVAWYGFPYSDGTAPASLIGDLDAPMLIIHGTADEPSPITDIYQYAGELDAAGKYFELKVYQGKPHGFMIINGELSDDAASNDAFHEMVDFFGRNL